MNKNENIENCNAKIQEIILDNEQIKKKIQEQNSEINGLKEIVKTLEKEITNLKDTSIKNVDTDQVKFQNTISEQHLWVHVQTNIQFNSKIDRFPLFQKMIS